MHGQAYSFNRGDKRPNIIFCTAVHANYEKRSCGQIEKLTRIVYTKSGSSYYGKGKFDPTDPLPIYVYLDTSRLIYLPH